MSHTPNYCTQAIEQFIEHQFMYRAAAPSDLDSIIYAQTRETADLLRRAEKFLMPEWGRIFDEDELTVVSDIETPNRLPYPIVACEFFCDYSKHDAKLSGEVSSSKRISLLVETEALREFAPQSWKWLVAIGKSAVLDVAGYVVIPVSYIDHAHIWSPAPAMGFMRRDEFAQSFTSHVVVTPLGHGAYSIYPQDERLMRAQRDIQDEAICSAHLLLALAMERTSVTTIAAPQQLNAKRARKGKTPMFEYKLLDIVADIMATPLQRAGRPHGKHASPRMHKRRGHVRRLGEGRVTWIRNTIVGKPTRGEIVKDYNVKGEHL